MDGLGNINCLNNFLYGFLWIISLIYSNNCDYLGITNQNIWSKIGLVVSTCRSKEALVGVGKLSWEI